MLDGAKLVLIAALDEKYGVGFQGSIPWKLTEDLKRFRVLTLDHSVVLGRTTYESCGHMLDRRRVYRISKTAERDGRSLHATSVGSALMHHRICGFYGPMFVAGGERIWEEGLLLSTEVPTILMLTRVEGQYQADAFFPFNPDHPRNKFKKILDGPPQDDPLGGPRSHFEMYTNI